MKIHFIPAWIAETLKNYNQGLAIILDRNKLPEYIPKRDLLDWEKCCVLFETYLYHRKVPSEMIDYSPSKNTVLDKTPLRHVKFYVSSPEAIKSITTYLGNEYAGRDLHHGGIEALMKMQDALRSAALPFDPERSYIYYDVIQLDSENYGIVPKIEDKEVLPNGMTSNRLSNFELEELSFARLLDELMELSYAHKPNIATHARAGLLKLWISKLPVLASASR